MAVLDLKGLLKIFGTDVRAVDEIDLHIEHGELISLLGPSGCGKTTTLRLVAGFIEPNAGEIVMDGDVVSNVEQRHPARAAQHEHDFPELRHLAP